MDAFSDYPTRPRSRRGRFVGLLGWGLSLALLALAGLVLRDRMDAVGRAGGLPGPLAVATAVVVYLVANAVLAEAWRRVVGLVGTDLHRRDAAWVWAASQLGRYAVGPAQVAGRAVLARRYGLSMTAGAVTALAELAWLISLTAVLAVATVPFWLPGAGDLTWLAAVAVVPAAALVVGITRPMLLIRTTGRLVTWAPIDKLTRGRLRGAASRLRVGPRQALALTGIYATNNLLRFAAFLALYAGVGGDVADDGLRAVGAYSVGQLVGWLAVFAPGGLGPREGATALVIAPAIGGGPALLLVAVVRLLELVSELAFFAIARMLRRPR